jgi:predicted MFS family arabinose efflux permease
MAVANPLSAVARPWSFYSTRQRWWMLAILFLVITSNYCDSFFIAVLLEPIKQEFHVSDTMLGLLSGLCFALSYAVAALPVARWADHGNRRSVITVTLAGWSAMTALCGFAQSFWQLAVARLGVGAAASGALPPAQSLIADYFPAERRATALGILTAAMNVGLLLGIAAGGYIAASQGWRAAFILVGAPGLVLALATRLFLAEPRRELGFPGESSGTESLSQTIRRLREKRSYLYALIGISVYCVYAFGVTMFLPSYMIRSLGASLEQASTTWGVAITAANVIGSVVGGYLTDALSRKDVRWHGWLPALTCTSGAVLYWLAFAIPHFWGFIGVEFLAETALAVGFPAVYSGVHCVCGHRRRSMAAGVLFLSMMVGGNGLGPVTAGVLSDAFSSAHGVGSLRYSLITLVVLMLPAAVAFYASARAMPDELED